MTVLFFMWGFMTVFNDVLIPRFKGAFNLSYYQAMMVQLAFFGAYFIGSLLYFAISVAKGDPIARIGYKNGVVVGLLLAATGSALFWPAGSLASYALFLTALGVVGIGFAMLQIAANPYVTILGPERTASSRLNLAQGFNSFGTTIGPAVGGQLIFEYFAHTSAHGAESVKVPYLAFCIVFVLLAVVFSFIRLPAIQSGAEGEPGGMGALKIPHVRLGMLAIFMYVGGEVSVGSAIISFLGQPDVANLQEVDAARYLSIFWGGLMIGRFMGAVELSTLSVARKRVLLAVIPAVGFLAFWAWRGWEAVSAYWPFLVLCWLAFQAGKSLAGRSLMIFSGLAVLLLAAAVVVGGKASMWCVLGVGLFSSIGWSNTFSLAIEGLGPLKSQASSLLVMAVLGGAILPPIQGRIADATGNLRLSFLVPMLAYAYVAFYGWKGHRVGRAAERAPEVPVA